MEPVTGIKVAEDLKAGNHSIVVRDQKQLPAFTLSINGKTYRMPVGERVDVPRDVVGALVDSDVDFTFDGKPKLTKKGLAKISGPSAKKKGSN